MDKGWRLGWRFWENGARCQQFRIGDDKKGRGVDAAMHQGQTEDADVGPVACAFGRCPFAIGIDFNQSASCADLVKAVRLAKKFGAVGPG